MKKLLMCGSLLMLLTSCGSTVVNKAKIAGAETIGKALTKLVDKEYLKLGTSYYDKSCDIEAIRLGTDATKFIKEKLKVSEPSGIMSLSVGGEIVKIACGLVASKLVPELINKNVGEYPCFGLVASNGAEAFIKDKLCNSIEF